MHYIYILKLSNNKYYTGITQDINKRLTEHINGKSKSTKYNRPISLAFLTTTFNRKSARRLEVRIKNKTAKLFMIQNKFDSKYSDLAKYPDVLRFTIKLKYRAITVFNEDLIIFL